MKLAPEGYPFIIVFAVVTVVACAAFGPLPAVVPFLLTVFMISFFRDPERIVPDAPDVFVSPADGKVIVVRELREEKYLQADVKQISIFMSPLNVHVNRAPCDGIIKTVRHNKGRYLAAYKDEASIRNENIELVLSSGHGDILVRQVAGFVARRAVCRKREGDALKRGERYGIIKFSSRVDVYLPSATSVAVRTGDVVRAGETVLARL
ncbi:MAG: phosphatidylserine decarboxylase family protein [Nitrospiraceae bacterium]|nr:phosphatidylserine decarboxylase family protein [Nitrospiraceae bacterium]